MTTSSEAFVTVSAPLSVETLQLASGQQLVAGDGWLHAQVLFRQIVVPGIVLANDGVLELELRFRSVSNRVYSFQTQLSSHDFFRLHNPAHRKWPKFVAHGKASGSIDTREDIQIVFVDGTVESGRLKYTAIDLEVMAKDRYVVMRAEWMWRDSINSSVVAYRDVLVEHFLWRKAYRPISRARSVSGSIEVLDIVELTEPSAIAAPLMPSAVYESS